MKRLLYCISVITMVTLSMLPSYAATYTPKNKEVSSNKANGNSMVLIKRGDEQESANSDNIVYVDQASTPFTALTNFLIKETAEDGLYTIILGREGEQVVTDTFYIGMNYASGDIKMVKRINPNDQLEDRVRYACSVSGIREFKTVIVKMDGEYCGFKLPSVWSVSGTSLLGVEIIADNGEKINQITDVWLSERELDDSGTLTKGNSTVTAQTE